MDRKAEKGSHYGSIEVIFGPMFSGKSEELIEALRIAEQYGRETVQAFYPHVDVRGNPETINTNNSNEFPATEVFTSKEIIAKLRPGVTFIGIDEAQFMDKGLPGVCLELAVMGRTVVVAGLATDFKKETYGPMGEILAIANVRTEKIARCTVCAKKTANRTQRMVREPDGTTRPARKSDEQTVVGGSENDIRIGGKREIFYEARCDDDHELPD